MHYLNRVVLPFICAVFAAFTLVAPPQANAHPSDDPHVPDAYYAGRDKITFDRQGTEGGFGANWQLDNTLSYIGNQRGGFGPNAPNLNLGQCENTTGPCIKMYDSCQPDAIGMYNFDRNSGGPISGYIVLNRCAGFGRDPSATCRSVMRLLGMHLHTGTGCTSNPWSLAANHPSDNALDTLEFGYNNKTGCQIPCGGPGNGRVGDDPEGNVYSETPDFGDGDPDNLVDGEVPPGDTIVDSGRP